MKKLLPSRYTVAQSVATCLLARHITPSVPRHAIGMPSASRHITKGGGGGKNWRVWSTLVRKPRGPPIADTWITIVIRPYLLRWPLREESLTPTKQPRLTSSSALLSELSAREVEGRLEEVLEEEEGVGRWPD